MRAGRNRGATEDGVAGLSYRTICGLLLVVLVIVVVALDREETQISFIAAP